MADTYRVRVLWDLAVPGELAGSHLDFEPGSLSAEAAQAPVTMDGIWDWWDLGVSGNPAAKTLWGSTVRLARVTFQRIAPTIGPVYSDDRADVPGTYATGGSGAPSLSIVASFRTDVSARRQRGRMFLPPPPENEVNADGSLNTPHVTNVRTSILGLATELESPARVVVGSVTMNHVIYSARAESPPGTPLPAANFGVTRYLVGTRVDSQRKRLGGEQTYIG